MASDPTRELQEEFLNTIRKNQEDVIDAIKTWVETVQAITPKIPSVQTPGADKLPKPEEVVASAYDFAEQLLTSQRRFAEDVLRATEPMITAGGSLPGPPHGGGGRRRPRTGPGPEPEPEPGQGSSQPS